MKQHEKNKNDTSKMTKTKKTSFGKRIIKVLIIFFAILFLINNLISSQTISPIYFQMMTGDQKSVVNFLGKIKFFPEYQNVLKMNGIIYGNSLTEEIYDRDNQKKQLINNLKQKLVYNPKERDILYSLYQLYLSQNDKNTATNYLRQAKIIDPSLK